MAVVFEEDFNTGPDGTALSTTNTVYDNVVVDVGAVAEFDSAQSVAGGLSAFVSVPVVAAIASLQDNFTARAVTHRRYYFRVPSAPPGNAELANAASAGTSAQMQITTGLLVRIRDGFTTVDTAVTPVVANEWFRVEWRIDATANTQEARLFYGANFHGTTADETLTGAYSGGSLDGFRDGMPGHPGGAWSLWLDEVVEDDAAFPGPAVVDTGTAGDPSDGFLAQLNRLAGTQDLGAAGAANTYAGTSGLEVVGALNVAAGTTGLDLQGVCNELAGTTGIGTVEALSRIIA